MIIVGTAGYSYEDWIGPVYPEGTDKKEMLALYAREFAFTEVNSSYYRMANSFINGRISGATVVKSHLFLYISGKKLFL